MKNKRMTYYMGGLFVTVCSLLVFSMVFTMVRGEYIMVHYDDYCQFRYGNNSSEWKYKDFGDFGEYCVELDYDSFQVSKRIKFDGYKMVNEFCNVPHFLDMTKWGHDCK